MKISSIFRIKRSSASTTPEPPPTPTYPTTSVPAHTHFDAGVAELITMSRRRLDHVQSEYVSLQQRYSKPPIYIRRDLHTAANEELLYAAAILEPGPLGNKGKKTEHGQDEAIPHAPYWYHTIGQLQHDFGLQNLQAFDSDFITDLVNRVDAEVARCTKVSRMVDHIVASASPTPSAPLCIILREWNMCCMSIANGTDIPTAVKETVQESQQYSDLRPVLDEFSAKEYFNLDVTDADWPSADPSSESRSKPAPRFVKYVAPAPLPPLPQVFVTPSNGTQAVLVCKPVRPPQYPIQVLRRRQ